MLECYHACTDTLTDDKDVNEAEALVVIDHSILEDVLEPYGASVIEVVLSEPVKSCDTGSMLKDGNCGERNKFSNYSMKYLSGSICRIGIQILFLFYLILPKKLYIFSA